MSETKNLQGLITMALIMIMFVAKIEGGELWFHKVHVQIYNQLNEAKNLQVHCKSKNDNLGLHQIPHGSFYEFAFGKNIWESTLFFCSFVFDNKLHYFEIYNQKRDDQDCTKHCVWRIQESGPCMLEYGTTEQFNNCYKWN